MGDALALRRGASLLALTLALALPAAGQSLREEYQLDDGDWRRVAQADPASPEGELQAIHRAKEQGHAGQARKLAKQWIKDHPDHPLAVEAYLLRGDARVAQKEYYKALYDYEYVIRVYPASEQYYTALEREFHVAQLFAHGVKRKWLGVRFMPAYAEAEEIFILIQERAPGSEIAERASIALGDYYFRRSQMQNSADAFDLFLTNYPASRYREKAMLRLIQAHLATFKGPRFNETGLIEASEKLRMFHEEFPASAERLGSQALLLRIEESKALKAYYEARWYERVREKVSAVHLYRRLIHDQPQTVAAQAALRRLSELGYTPVAPEVEVEGEEDTPVMDNL